MTNGIEGGVQQHEDEEDGDRHDHRQPGQGALLVFERATPFDPVTRRQPDLARDRRIGIAHEPVHVAATHIHLDHRVALQLLAAHERIAFSDADIGHLGQRHDGTTRRPQRNPPQRLDRTARCRIQSHRDVVALDALQQHADRFAAEAVADDRQHLLRVHAMPRQRRAIHRDADLRLADIGFQRQVGHTRHGPEYGLELAAEPIQHLQVLSVELERQRGTHAGDQLLHPHLDRLGVAGHHVRHHLLQRLLHRIFQLLDAASGGPTVLRLERGVDLHVIHVGSLTLLGTTDHRHRGLHLGEFPERRGNGIAGADRLVE